MPPKRGNKRGAEGSKCGAEGNKRGAESKGKKKKSGNRKAYVPSYVQEGEKCVVCGDNSTGTHYRAMTCEGCKGFFRRTIQKSAGQEPKLVCKRNRNCTITPQTRNTCQYCRYRKCIIGKMDPSSVLTEEERRRLQLLISTNRHERRLKEGQALTQEERDILIKLGKIYKDVKFSELYTFIEKEEYVKEFLTLNTMEVNTDVQASDKKMSSSLIHVIKFIWSIPGIHNVSEEDLMKLFYSHSLDIVGFRLAELYDTQENELCFRNFRLKESDIDRYNYMREIFNFAKYYSQFVTNDGIILGCLCAIRFLSVDNISLHYGITVENILETMNDIFIKYLIQEKVASMRDIYRYLADFENIRDYHSKLLTKLALIDSFQPNYSDLFNLSKDSILDKDSEFKPSTSFNTQTESGFQTEEKCCGESDASVNLQNTNNDNIKKNIAGMSTSLDLSHSAFHPSEVNSSSKLPSPPELNPSSMAQAESGFQSEETFHNVNDSSFNLQNTNSDEAKKISGSSTSLDLSCPTLHPSDVCSSELPPPPVYCSLVPPQYPSIPALHPYTFLISFSPVMSLNHTPYNPSPCSQPLFQPYSILNSDECLRGQRTCHSEAAALNERPEKVLVRPCNFSSDTLGPRLAIQEYDALRQDSPHVSHVQAPSHNSQACDVNYDDNVLLDMSMPKKSNLPVTVAQEDFCSPTLTVTEPMQEESSTTQQIYSNSLKVSKEHGKPVTATTDKSNMHRQNDMIVTNKQKSSNSTSTENNELNSSCQCTTLNAAGQVKNVNLEPNESAEGTKNFNTNKTPAKGIKKLWIDHYSQSSFAET